MGSVTGGTREHLCSLSMLSSQLDLNLAPSPGLSYLNSSFVSRFVSLAAKMAMNSILCGDDIKKALDAFAGN